jgi:hypothetical protein
VTARVGDPNAEICSIANAAQLPRAGGSDSGNLADVKTKYLFFGLGKLMSRCRVELGS